jgi:hypothetical protein
MKCLYNQQTGKPNNLKIKKRHTNDIGIFYILISSMYYLLHIHEFKNPRNVLCEQTTNIGIHDIRYFTVDLS